MPIFRRRRPRDSRLYAEYEAEAKARGISTKHCTDIYKDLGLTYRQALRAEVSRLTALHGRRIARPYEREQAKRNLEHGGMKP